MDEYEARMWRRIACLWEPMIIAGLLLFLLAEHIR